VRIRTVQWMEGKIIAKLSRQHKVDSSFEIQGIRSIEEEDIFDIAIEYLISRGIVHRTRREGIILYKLAA